MTKLRVLDLFSGTGSFSLGLERTEGFRTVAFCEVNQYRRGILRRHWPEVPIYDDIRELTGARLAADGIAADVICGGFPCQNVSQAGAVWGVNTGLAGQQSGLWREYRRLIEEVGPSFVIIENVRALLGNGLVTVLQDLGALGFDAEWHCVPASRVGAIQNRDRVWIIAYSGEVREQGLLAGQDLGVSRQGWTCRQADLPGIYADPFGGDRWPQPIIRGGDDRPAHWVDRIEACGDAVVPQIPELIGHAILEASR